VEEHEFRCTCDAGGDALDFQFAVMDREMENSAQICRCQGKTSVADALDPINFPSAGFCRLVILLVLRTGSYGIQVSEYRKL